MPVIKDKDLQSIQEARILVGAAHEAQKVLSQFSQQQVDAVVDRMAQAVHGECENLARLAVEETGYGNIADKTLKNRFASEKVHRYIRPLLTVGVIREDRENGVVEIAAPGGVTCAIIPSTNPTSTAIYKILICIKARNCVVLSPHPAAVGCIGEATRIMVCAAREAGLPDGAIACMSNPTLEGTTELMRHRLTALILATGGIGLVRAAYSSGKPAFGVGPGNVPAYIDRSANVTKAVRDVLTGKCFDNGTLCSSEQSMVVDRPVAEQALDELKKNRAHILSAGELDRMNRVIASPSRSLNPAIVGKAAPVIASMAGISVPEGTRALVGRIDGVGKDHPFSMEKLSPLLAFFVVDGWEQGCERCNEILRFGGTGHTMAVHAADPKVIQEFGLHKLACRIVVNTPATLGSIGYTTNLVPSMTLGCGTWGGNITTDNISPMNLVNIKRLAYETRPLDAGPAARPSAWNPPPSAGQGGGDAAPTRDTIRQIVEELLKKKASSEPPIRPLGPALPEPAPPIPPKAKPAPVAFVCEDDVRRALGRHETIWVNAKTIITPAARDLGEDKGVFSWV